VVDVSKTPVPGVWRSLKHAWPVLEAQLPLPVSSQQPPADPA